MVCNSGYKASNYAGMTNIVWDDHYYNWVSKYSKDQTTNNQVVANEAAASQQTASADGVVPVLLGEYGPSTDGKTLDAGSMQAVTAVIDSGLGSAAWHWGSIDCCNNLNNGSTLTSPYGQAVAQFIASGKTGTPNTGTGSSDTSGVRKSLPLTPHP
jgi:type 1 glutamine amidotransferase